MSLKFIIKKAELVLAKQDMLVKKTEVLESIRRTLHPIGCIAIKTRPFIGRPIRREKTWKYRHR